MILGHVNQLLPSTKEIEQKLETRSLGLHLHDYRSIVLKHPRNNARSLQLKRGPLRVMIYSRTQSTLKSSKRVV
jgi:hypothetical protein